MSSQVVVAGGVEGRQAGRLLGMVCGSAESCMGKVGWVCQAGAAGKVHRQNLEENGRVIG